MQQKDTRMANAIEVHNALIEDMMGELNKITKNQEIIKKVLRSIEFNIRGETR